MRTAPEASTLLVPNHQHRSEACVQIPPFLGVECGPWSPRKLCALLACFGPAAILASLSVGAGETIVVVRTGAWARYDLLWVVLLSVLVKGVFVTYMLGRYTAVTGESIGQRLVRLPGPRGWLLLAIIGIEVLFAPFAWVPIAKPCGNLLHYLVNYDYFAAVAPEGSSAVWCQNAYTTLFIAAALAMSLSHTYHRLEKEQLIICGILVTGTILGTLMVRPDIWASLEGTFLRIGRLPDALPQWAPEDARSYPLLSLATVFAYVGGNAMSYIAYAHWVAIRGWGLNGHPDIERIRQRAATSPRINYLPLDDEQRLRLRRLVAPLRWDVALGGAVLFIVTATFMMAGAATLYDRHSSFEGWSLLTDQAYIWRNIHPWLVPIYHVTVMAALLGTLTALPEVYARVTQEFFSAIWPQRRWTYQGVKKAIAGAILVGSVFVIWTDLSFDTLIQCAGLFVATLAVAAVAAAALYLDWKLPRGYRTRRPLFVCAAAASIVLVVASSMSSYGLAKKLLTPKKFETVSSVLEKSHEPPRTSPGGP